MFGWFLETSVVAAVLCGLVLLVGRSTRLGPAARHALWLVILLKMLTPPMVHWPQLPVMEENSTRVIACTRPGDPPEYLLSMLVDYQASAGRAVQDAISGRTGLRGETTDAADVELVFVEEGERRSLAATSASRLLSLWNRSRRVFAPLWWFGTVGFGLIQLMRISRFRTKLSASVPAPEWLLDRVDEAASTLGVAPPTTVVTSGVSSPILWCAGRARLLIPEVLLKSLGEERWGCVLTHELAHLRRRDQWVSRLTLLGGLLWWWNPLYWLVRRRLEVEAELACDAWVVQTLPKGRRPYAEALIEVCRNVSKAVAPSPALGVGSAAGRFFERRLRMILRESVSCKLTLRGLLASGTLGLLAIPSWSLAQSDEKTSKAVEITADGATFDVENVEVRLEGDVKLENNTAEADEVEFTVNRADDGDTNTNIAVEVFTDEVDDTPQGGERAVVRRAEIDKDAGDDGSLNKVYVRRLRNGVEPYYVTFDEPKDPNRVTPLREGSKELQLLRKKLAEARRKSDGANGKEEIAQMEKQLAEGQRKLSELRQSQVRGRLSKVAVTRGQNELERARAELEKAKADFDAAARKLEAVQGKADQLKKQGQDADGGPGLKARSFTYTIRPNGDKVEPKENKEQKGIIIKRTMKDGEVIQEDIEGVKRDKPTSLRFHTIEGQQGKGGGPGENALIQQHKVLIQRHMDAQGAPTSPGSNPDVEKRINSLEKKLDELINELKGLRKEQATKVQSEPTRPDDGKSELPR